MITRTVGAALSRFDPIGLDDLNAQADLQVRVDRKYVLPTHRAVAVLDRMDREEVYTLQIADRREFDYRSLYFDTPTLFSYRSTALKRRRRFKVRTRQYADTEQTFLEVKTRGPRGATVKHRLPHHAGPLALSGGGRTFVSAILRSQAVLVPEIDDLAPVLATGYRRSTLLLPAREGRQVARATIDTDLCWSPYGLGPAYRDEAGSDDPRQLPRNTGPGVTLSGVAIIETKSRGTASVLDRLLWTHGCRPVSISKYGTGMAALHPELPATRWHRILGRLHPYATAIGTAEIAAPHHHSQEVLSCVAPF